MRGLILAGAMLAAAGAAQAATVGVDHGNIVVNGKAITHAGQDSDPVMAPDGKRVVFRRAPGGKPLEGCSGDMMQAQPAELWSVNADGTGAKKLLATHREKDVHRTLCDFGAVQFNSNGQLLYFETPAWATSGAIHVYDFKSGTERFFIDGNGATVLRDCREARYRDAIVASQHRYFVGGGSYDWLWLFSPAGKEIGPVGEDDAMLKDLCA